MKLRNKKTGEVKEFVLFDGMNELQGGATLAMLNEEWEDYNDSLEHYYISHDGDVVRMSELISSKLRKGNIEIGNYFETKEDAKLAVKKLKAWKRLRDKGVYFKRSHIIPSGQPILEIKSDELVTVTFNGAKEYWNDLDLLFGGEDE